MSDLVYWCAENGKISGVLEKLRVSVHPSIKSVPLQFTRTGGNVLEFHLGRLPRNMVGDSHQQRCALKRITQYNFLTRGRPDGGSHYPEKASFRHPSQNVWSQWCSFCLFQWRIWKGAACQSSAKILNEWNFVMKWNDIGPVIPENLKKFLKLDNKAISCKKTCFYKQSVD